jgi:opacity protein-like surface antigen
LVALFLVMCGTFAVAQKGEIAGGWNFLHVDSDFLPTQSSVPGGFFVDGTYYFAHVIGLTGDFDYNKKTFNSDSNFAAGDQVRTYAFHAGPRVKARIGTLEPFAHVLFGVTNLKGSSFTGSSVSDNAFSIKMGGGLDVKVFPHLALRLGELNFYLTKFSVNSAVSAFNINDHQNNVTFSVGAVIR